MPDFLDRVIQRCRRALHEGHRVSAAKRRHERVRQAEANVRLADLEDRIAFHVPIRDRIPGEAFKEYRAYQEGVKMHRHQLLIMAISAIQPNDGLWGDDAPDAFTRGDF